MAVTLKNARYEQLEHYHFDPKAVPTEAEDAVVGDCYLEMMDFSNPTAGAIVVTILDKADTPLSVRKISIAAGSDYSRIFLGRFCPGGINWVADGAGLIGYLRVRK